MSNSALPLMPGLTWPMVKQPSFNTKVQRAVSGKEYRAAFMQYPLYTFTLSYSVLRDGLLPDGVTYAELATLAGFYLARQGSFDSFLYTDPSDNLVTAQQFGTGDGVTTLFPLKRTYGAGGFTADDLVQNVNAITGIYDNGTPVVQGAGPGKYTIDSSGNVTFGTAPVAAHVLTWTGAYYYRCRFVRDSVDFSGFGNKLWDLKQLQFVGSPQNKV